MRFFDFALLVVSKNIAAKLCVGIRRINTNIQTHMVRKLKSGEFRIYSRSADKKTGKRKNLGTFATRGAAEKHEREIQYFKQH